jgi:hypothetical protein
VGTILLSMRGVETATPRASEKRICGPRWGGKIISIPYYHARTFIVFEVAISPSYLLSPSAISRHFPGKVTLKVIPDTYDYVCLIVNVSTSLFFWLNCQAVPCLTVRFKKIKTHSFGFINEEIRRLLECIFKMEYTLLGVGYLPNALMYSGQNLEGMFTARRIIYLVVLNWKLSTLGGCENQI